MSDDGQEVLVELVDIVGDDGQESPGIVLSFEQGDCELVMSPEEATAIATTMLELAAKAGVDSSLPA